jgi:hypothetical protein
MTLEERRHKAKFFIKKFESIDEDKWCAGTRDNGLGQRCALGHANPSADRAEVMYGDTDETRAVGELFDSSGFAIIGQVKVAEINNGFDPRYQQPTPKQRILAALRDLLAL